MEITFFLDKNTLQNSEALGEEGSKFISSFCEKNSRERREKSKKEKEERKKRRKEKEKDKKKVRS